jgi:RecA-family ATPase
MDLQRFARALGGEVNSGQVLAPGPGHSPKDRSLSVKLDTSAPDGFVVHSFAGDDPIRCKDYVRHKAGIEPFKPNGNVKQKPMFNIGKIIAAQKSNSGPPRGNIVATYDYSDTSGTLLYQVVRLDPKDFRQRRPDGKGGWVWSLDDRRVLYRLPELGQYPDASVFICEGEKDADRVASLGHCATTVAGGKWTDECIKDLAGRDCLILEDNDEAGRAKAHEAAAALHHIAKTVRIVRLPDLPDKGDVSDWLDANPRDADKLVDICFAAPVWTSAESAPTAPPSPAAPLVWLDMSSWDDEPVPQRKWAILGRVPLLQAGLFSGEGGTGKSILEMTKDVAHVAGKDWLGTIPEQGPAIYLGAEDGKDELHIRLAEIAKHYGVSFKQLVDGGLHVLCLLGQDATLCAATGKSGKVETTELYRLVYEAAGDIKPINISIDTLSRAFAGNEIDRVQVYAFAMHMQALATVAGGSVTVLSHPSLSGIASGSGISGSTAWHGAFRFRQYLTGVKTDAGEQPDNDVRALEFKKNQYGPIGEAIIVRYQNGLFLPEPSISSLDQISREQAADDVFLTLLARFAREGRNVSHHPGPTYAPKIFAAETEARNLRQCDLNQAMRRLFAGKKIRVESYGKPSRPHTRLAAC